MVPWYNSVHIIRKLSNYPLLTRLLYPPSQNITIILCGDKETLKKKNKIFPYDTQHLFVFILEHNFCRVMNGTTFTLRVKN
jgi:hypothetical protein